MASLAADPRTDPTPADAADVRLLSTVLGGGRVAIGLGLAVAPRMTLNALGFSDHGTAAVAVARIAGGRDLVMGAATLLALGDAQRLRAASLANAVADAGDALTFASVLASGDGDVRDAGLRGLAAAVPAALAGAWVATRLR
jgi:hypothetical protein